jgi:hypothetical protein
MRSSAGEVVHRAEYPSEDVTTAAAQLVWQYVYQDSWPEGWNGALERRRPGDRAGDGDAHPLRFKGEPEDWSARIDISDRSSPLQSLLPEIRRNSYSRCSPDPRVPRACISRPHPPSAAPGWLVPCPHLRTSLACRLETRMAFSAADSPAVQFGTGALFLSMLSLGGSPNHCRAEAPRLPIYRAAALRRRRFPPPGSPLHDFLIEIDVLSLRKPPRGFKAEIGTVASSVNYPVA